ncbi:MAG: hypothetical protein V5A55_09295 [Halovenus sp.]
MPREYTRRQVTGAALAAGVAALAGCLGGGDGDEASDDDGGTRVIDEFVLSNHTLSGEFPLRLVDAESGDLVARYHGHPDGNSNWHRQPVEVPLDDRRSLQVEVINQQREQIPLDEDGFTFDIRRTEETPADLFDVTRTGEFITFSGGSSEGVGAFVIDLVDGGDVEFTTVPCEVAVVA